MEPSTIEPMWGLGLTPTDTALLSGMAGGEFRLINFEADELPFPAGAGEESPLLVWVAATVWEAMPAPLRKAYQEWESPLRILILNEGDAEASLERTMEEGFLTTVRRPLCRETVSDVLHRAKELSGLYTDIISMTKEILLERELLARKTDQLSFLNRILSRAAESLDARTILSQAREDMELLFPFKALHAVFWQEKEGQLDADVYVGDDLVPESQQAWIARLLEAAQTHQGMAVRGFDVTHIEAAHGAAGSRLDPGPPVDGEVHLLPLTTSQSTFGLLALAGRGTSRLAKDQIQTLHAAVTHLALALKNALLYREAQFRAEFDGLTRIHNRQSFDNRLTEELDRHRRYNQDLSLLMIDLDYFKQINDTYGHTAGDMVLHEVGVILSQNLRSSDFAARYGGEEFAVLLPYTSADKACILAERLRDTIGGRIFHIEGRSFRITASIGLANANDNKDGDILRNADRALYMAKNGGRDMVCRVGEAKPRLAVQQ